MAKACRAGFQSVAEKGDKLLDTHIRGHNNCAMHDFLEWAKAFVGWFKAPTKSMIAVLILSALGLFLPQMWISKIGMTEWRSRYHVTLVLLFGFCTVFLCLSGLEKIYQRHQLRKRLHNLSNDEKRLVARFVARGLSTIMADSHEDGIGKLVSDKILFRSSGPLPDGMAAYSLTPYISKYVASNPDQILKAIGSAK